MRSDRFLPQSTTCQGSQPFTGSQKAFAAKVSELLNAHRLTAYALAATPPHFSVLPACRIRATSNPFPQVRKPSGPNVLTCRQMRRLQRASSRFTATVSMTCGTARDSPQRETGTKTRTGSRFLFSSPKRAVWLNRPATAQRFPAGSDHFANHSAIGVGSAAVPTRNCSHAPQFSREIFLTRNISHAQ